MAVEPSKTIMNDVPTEKQYDYAVLISEELGIELPQVFTKNVYSDFISTYEKDYKLSLQEYHLEEEDDY